MQSIINNNIITLPQTPFVKHQPKFWLVIPPSMFKHHSFNIYRPTFDHCAILKNRFYDSGLVFTIINSLQAMAWHSLMNGKYLQHVVIMFPELTFGFFDWRLCQVVYIIISN